MTFDGYSLPPDHLKGGYGEKEHQSLKYPDKVKLVAKVKKTSRKSGRPRL